MVVAAQEALLEREEELLRLRGLLDGCVEGRGGLFVVDGPAGIGKTRLLQAVIGLARAEGAEVLRAVGGELERELAFGVVLQLFESRLRRASARERADLLDGPAALAGPLVESWSSRSRGAEARALMHCHGLFWLTCNLGARAPVVIVVDDAHWADPPSLAFLLYLAQRLEELPIALVVATRPEGSGGAGLLAQLAAHPLAHVLQPAPLSAPAVGELVRARLPDCADEFAQACSRATGGNPFLVHELLAALASERIRPTAAAAARVAEYAPASISRAVLIRLARLPSEAAAIARAVAVLGDDAALRHVATLAGVEHETASRLVEALGAAGILTPAEPLRFTHPLLRSALYSDVSRADRERLHAGAARLLAAERAAPERVATHLLVTRPLSDQWAVERLREAGGAAMAAGAPGSAVAYLRRAHAEPPQGPVRVQVLVELGDAETTAGEPTAPDRLTEAACLAADRRVRARILLRLGRALYLQGRLAEAAEAFDGGRADATEDAELSSELQAGWLAVARLLPSLRAEARARIAPLLDRPRFGGTRGERVLLAHAAEQLAFAGDACDRARQLALRSLAGGALLEDETSDGPTWMIAAAALGRCEDFASCDPLIEAALVDARRRGSLVGFGNASYMSAWVACRTGHLAEAVADAELAVRARRHGWQQSLPLAYVELARSLMERGDLAAADAALAEAASDRRWEKTSWHGFVLAVRGELRLHQGRPAEALENLLAAGEIALAVGAPNPAVGPWRSRAARAAAQLGDADEAARLAGEELELARRFGAPGAIGVALSAAGSTVPGAATIDPLREAVTALERSPLRLEHARALIELGAALRGAGRRAEARTPLRRGLDLAHLCGTGLLERRARQELLASGARPRRSAQTGAEALTPSEHRIARMAADGLTNREIAQALFLSPKTVEMHLGHAYGKLGIHSRGRLTAALERPETTGH